MPNEAVVNYLTENREKFSQDVLVAQLKQAGYPEADVMEGVGAVYGTDGMPPVPAAVSLRYAGFWIRFVAGLIDGIFLGLVLTPFKFMVFDSADGNSVMSAVQMLSMWIYSVLMVHYKGATLGKMALGLQVVADDGSRAPIGKIVLRETVGKLASAFTLLIGYMMAGFTQRKQALHDMIAGTVVVYTR